MSAMFAPVLFAVIALSTQVTTALRDALSSSVPLFWTPPAAARPWIAAAVGAIAAFCGALGTAAATGGVTEGALVAAGVAAIGNLAIVVPKLIYTESNAAQVARNTSDGAK